MAHPHNSNTLRSLHRVITPQLSSHVQVAFCAGLDDPVSGVMRLRWRGLE